MGLSGLLVFLAAWWLLLRAAMLVHELGHAAYALQQTSGPVLVVIGGRGKSVKLKVGRLHILISVYGMSGICRFKPGSLSRAQHLKRILAGPLANLVVALLFVLPERHTAGLGREVLGQAILVNALTGVVNLVPFYSQSGLIAGLPSDGLRAWSLLRGKPLSPPSPRPRQITGSWRRRRVSPVLLTLPLCGLVLGLLLARAHAGVPGAAERATVAVALTVLVGYLATRRPARSKASRSQPPMERPQQSSPARMKRCPFCGAEVHPRARVCYCYHEFTG